MTLSCAALRWPELFQIIAKTQGKNMTEEEIEALSYNELYLIPAQCNNSTSGAIATYHQPTEVSDDILRQNVRSLNTQQRLAYDRFLSWCRNKMKNSNSLKPVEVESLYLFLTGGGGAGKSHLIKTIYHTSVETIRHPPITLNYQQCC